MKLTTRSAALIALTSIASVASAAPPDVIATSSGVHQWGGFYAGLNAGAGINTTCNTWTANGPLANTPAFNNRDCPNKTAFVGGLQIGYNFQYEEWVWGFGADYDFYSASTKNRSLVYTGAVFPMGTYTFNGKNSPNGFGILGPRIGYAVDNWLPYFRVGGVFTSGSSNSTVSFTPTGAAAPTATFNGGRNYKSSGFGIGAGVDLALEDSWSLRAEYTYVNLGKGSNTTTTCTGVSAAACATFAGFSLDSIHNSLTFSVIRIGVNYSF
jgi:outer membrane immunogenic protein